MNWLRLTQMRLTPYCDFFGHFRPIFLLKVLQGGFLNLADFEIEKLGMKFSMKWGNNDSICLLFTRVSDFSIHAILGPETRIFGKSGKNYLNRPNHRNGFGSPSRAANAIKVFLEIAPPSQGGAHEKI